MRDAVLWAAAVLLIVGTVFRMLWLLVRDETTAEPAPPPPPGDGGRIARTDEGRVDLDTTGEEP